MTYDIGKVKLGGGFVGIMSEQMLLSYTNLSAANIIPYADESYYI